MRTGLFESAQTHASRSVRKGTPLCPNRPTHFRANRNEWRNADSPESGHTFAQKSARLDYRPNSSFPRFGQLGFAFAPIRTDSDESVAIYPFRSGRNFAHRPERIGPLLFVPIWTQICGLIRTNLYLRPNFNANVRTDSNKSEFLPIPARTPFITQ